jgi:phosphoenolpyruvate carboxykinase (ATP)
VHWALRREGARYFQCHKVRLHPRKCRFQPRDSSCRLRRFYFDRKHSMVSRLRILITLSSINIFVSAYPIEYIHNAKIPCISTNHPSNIILLTCDARGVLPPISKLNSAQTMFHFISGYTSKMAGTEDGVTEPQATFSSCFAQPFLALHPMRYAKMLAEKIEQHSANAWLLNTGWVGAGATSGGKRCPLKYTRAILDAIHSGELAKVEYETYETFNLAVPKTCTGVPSELLNPKNAWSQGHESFKNEVTKLGTLFVENFKKYESEATPEVIAAGPDIKV